MFLRRKRKHNQVKFRAMRAADLSAVVALENEQAFPWTEKMLGDCLNAPYENIVLEDDGVLIGFCILSVAADESEVLNILITDDRRRQGFGTLLLQHMITDTKWRGVKKMHLEVRASNTPALKFYESLGFKVVNIRKDYYSAVNGREDALVLSYVYAQH